MWQGSGLNGFSFEKRPIEREVSRKSFIGILGTLQSQAVGFNIITSISVKWYCYMIEVYSKLTSAEAAKPSRSGQNQCRQ